MEFMTATILSGIVYDMLKRSIVVSAQSLKNELIGWIVDESVVQKTAIEINKVQNLELLGERGLQQSFEQNKDLIEILKEIKVEGNKTTINQKHSGSGDNVGRDKIVNKS